MQRTREHNCSSSQGGPDSHVLRVQGVQRPCAGDVYAQLHGEAVDDNAQKLHPTRNIGGAATWSGRFMRTMAIR